MYNGDSPINQSIHQSTNQCAHHQPHSTPNNQGKRRTRFIDPATAQHFHLVHRSQRDLKANDPEAPQFVLLPARVGVGV